MAEGRPSREPRRGAALLIVLMLCALLSSLAAVALRSGLSGARAAVAFERVMQADTLGLSVGDLVLAYVSLGDPDRRRGGHFAVRLPGAEVEVEYLSESARIDANAASPALIGAMLRTLGAEEAEVAAVLTRVAALRNAKPRDEGDGEPEVASPLGRDASSTPVATATAPPVLPNQGGGIGGGRVPAIQSTADVARAWGLGEALARQVRPLLTVASRSAKIDPILAGRSVVLALFGGDADRADDFIARRAQGFANRDSALLLIPQDAQTFVDFDDAEALRAVARVTLAGRFRRRYEVVLELPKGRAGARILSWQKLG